MPTRLLAALVLPLALLRPVVPRAADDGCDGRNAPGETSSQIRSIHSNSDSDGSRTLRYLAFDSSRCVQASMIGAITFTDDDRGIASLGVGAMASFRERLPRSDRVVTVARGAGGAPVYAATLDGREVSFDGPMREWFGGLLREVLRETGVNVPARVARLRARGGIPAVLEEIGQIQSGSAKREHYLALLDTPDLTPEDQERIVARASRDLAGSSSDLRAVLERVPTSARWSADTRGAVHTAVESISSSSDKAAVLSRWVESGDRDQLLLALRDARGISSGSDRSRLLVLAAPRAFARDDEPLRSAFFEALAGISSSSDQRRVLEATIPQAQAAPGLVPEAIRATERITSSSDKAAVLLAVVRQRLVTTPALRESLLHAVRTITSDSEYRRVMDAYTAGN